MAVPEVKKLVEWVKNGNEPEGFGAANQALRPSPLAGEGRVRGGGTARAKEPKSAQTPSPLGRGFEGVRSTGSRGDSPHESVVHTGPLPVSAVGETGRVRGAENSLSAQIGFLIAGNELAKKLHLPAQALSRLLPTFTRLFQRVIGLFEWMGVKNRFVATCLALFLVLFVGSNLIGWSNRLIGRLVYSWTHPSPALSLPKEPVVSDRRESNPPALSPAEASIPAPVNQPVVSDQRESNPFAPATAKPESSVKKDAASTLVPAPQSSAKPQTVSSSGTKKNDDPLQAVGDAVKGVSNAVNTAKEGESAVDGAKKLLGL